MYQSCFSNYLFALASFVVHLISMGVYEYIYKFTVLLVKVELILAVICLLLTVVYF